MKLLPNKKICRAALWGAACLFSATPTGAAEETIKAAGKGDNIALYFEAIIDRNGAVNPAVNTGRIILYAKGRDPIQMDCNGADEVARGFQSTPYGRGTEGRAVALSCGQKASFLFVLNPPEYQERNDGNCKGSKLIGSKLIALAASFGHQAFCMEDWADVIDPSETMARLVKFD